MLSRKVTLFGLLSLAFVVTLLTIGSQPVSAATYNGTGYFTNNPAQTTLQWNEDVFPGRTSASSPDTIPDRARNKAGFIGYIKDMLNGGPQQRTAAAYVINTMVGAGKDGEKFNKQRTPSPAMIEDWEKRINDPSITMTTDFQDPNRYGGITFYDHSINDVFLTNYNPGGRQLILFKHGASVVYVIEKPCGNPVGRLSLPVPKDNWEATPNTTSRKSAIKPGQNIPWHHTVKKTGPDNTTDPIYWEIKQFKKDNGGPNEVGITIDHGTMSKNKTNGEILSKDTTYLNASESDIGKRICQYIRIKPYAMVDNNLKDEHFRSSDPECVPVRKEVENGDFVPNAIVSPDYAEPNTEYYWHATVTDGFIPQSTHPHPPVPQKEESITWEVHKIIYPPSVTSEYAGGTGLFACPAGATCNQESSPPGHALKQPGSPNPLRVPTSGDNTGVVPDDLASGSRICYVSSVHLPKGLEPHTHWYDDYRWEQTGTDSHDDPVYGWVNHPYPVQEEIYKDESTRLWRHSAADCVTVAKRPRVQVRGEDVAVRGNIITSVSKFADGKTFGSWVEYGAFSLGENDFSASGAAYNEGSTSDDRAAWSKLTFANYKGEPYGNFGSIPDAPKIAEYYASKITGPWSGSILDDNSGVFSTGSTSISGIGVSKSYVIYSSGDVTIDHNIEYSNGPFDSGAKLPQVIIIAKNIKITGNVTKVDAWLVTAVSGADHGSINTCSDVADTAPLTDGDCRLPLVVNGPVVTGNLLLRRTYGARPGIDRGVAAEIFRLRPDAFIWGYGQSSSDSVAQTVDISELPPRF